MNHPFSFGWVKTAKPLSSPLTLYLYYIILFAVCQYLFQKFFKIFFQSLSICLLLCTDTAFWKFLLCYWLAFIISQVREFVNTFWKFSEKIFGRCLRVYNIMNAPAFSDFQMPWREPLAFDTLIITHLWEFVKTFLRIFEKYFLTLTVDAVPRV